MAKKLFVSGTGTDVGKTFVSGLILKKLNDNGINCGYYKLVFKFHLFILLID